MTHEAVYEPHAPARVLFVCTGNICRSPFAELSLRKHLRLNGVSGVRVWSAGTRAVVGHGAAKEILTLLVEHGIDGGGFRAQSLTTDMIESADVILTAAAGHRSEVLQMVPRAHARTFTIRQFARLISVAEVAVPADDTAKGRLRELVRACAAARGVTQPSSGQEDDVSDPWGGPVTGYRRSAEALRGPLLAIAGALSPVTAPRQSRSHRATTSTA